MTIYVDDQIDGKSQKLDALKAATGGQLVLADIEKVHADFDSTEHEAL